MHCPHGTEIGISCMLCTSDAIAKVSRARRDQLPPQPGTDDEQHAALHQLYEAIDKASRVGALAEIEQESTAWLLQRAIEDWMDR